MPTTLDQQRKMHVTNSSTFQVPIAGSRSGSPVRILAVGDEANSSPVYLYVDENGDSGWAPISEFQIVDTNCLPLSQNALNSISSASGPQTGLSQHQRR